MSILVQTIEAVDMPLKMNNYPVVCNCKRTS